jgi:hypothetical protein
VKAKKLILAVAVAAISTPTAIAGTNNPAAPVVSEKAAGLWQPQRQLPGRPIVSEKTAGLFPTAESSPALVSEKTTGLWRKPAPIFSRPVLAAPDGGFDWTDAGIGAAVMLGSLLLASAGAVAIRRRGLLAH